MSVKERLETYVKYKKISNSAFCRSIGVSAAFISSMRVSLQPDKAESIALRYPDLNISWLLTGSGEMLNTESNALNENKEYSVGESGNSVVSQPENEIKKRIPFYDDVISMGGINGSVVDVSKSHIPSEWIDAGDWFKDATAAIRHYGDSMTEYASGSILVLKRVTDRRLIIWGRNYSIETTEFRITKQLQDGGEDFYMGYSSNLETYPDGRQIHSPIRIPKDTVRNIDQVIGCVTKEYSSGPIRVN